MLSIHSMFDLQHVKESAKLSRGTYISALSPGSLTSSHIVIKNSLYFH